LANNLCDITHSSNAFFYDAIAPVLDGESIDLSIAFWQNRETRTAAYEKRIKNEKESEVSIAQSADAEQNGDYLNIPLNKDEYFEFVKKLLAGEKVPYHNFESPKFFSGCQPIEALAESGPRTLSFGPMKPRGITDPRTGRSPWACIQLRRESLGNNAFNMVGFQTRLTWPAQREIFKSLPALQNADFFRMGSMHRNTYFCAPSVLSHDFSLKENPKIFLAGQLMGVEGYIESAAIGLFVGHIIGRRLRKQPELTIPPPSTALGALMRYIFFAEAKHFAPMNIHWGLFDALTEADTASIPDSLKNKKIDKSLKRDLLAKRAEKDFAIWKSESKIES
jgi:methylenetetrahydrofolate--tRNA-(uracil-5-)-methyltransferase